MHTNKLALSVNDTDIQKVQKWTLLILIVLSAVPEAICRHFIWLLFIDRFLSFFL